MSDWAREYFERGYAQRWGLPPVSDRIRLEASGLWELLHLTPSSRVVDIGCGHGRHALALAERGPAVFGVDFAATLLIRAQRDGADLGVQAHWIRGDMRRLPLRSGSFSAAVSIDAFGFFEAEEENQAVLMEAARVLGPGGRLGLKVVNGGPILDSFRETDYEERDGTLVKISRTLSLAPPRMIEKITVSGTAGGGEYERHQRLYRVEELGAAFERAGLSVTGVLASPAGAPFEPATSFTMWVLGQRHGAA
jgi:ubiquinone/menaquinone biosynthesis C-methylase UbiE